MSIFANLDSTPEGSDEFEGPDLCSAKGCQSAATWQLQWNNPKIHTPERRKIWLACNEHRTSLGEFLTARNFLKDTVPHPA